MGVAKVACQSSGFEEAGLAQIADVRLSDVKLVHAPVGPKFCRRPKQLGATFALEFLHSASRESASVAGTVFCVPGQRKSWVHVDPLVDHERSPRGVHLRTEIALERPLSRVEALVDDQLPPTFVYAAAEGAEALEDSFRHRRGSRCSGRFVCNIMEILRLSRHDLDAVRWADVGFEGTVTWPCHILLL